MTLRAITVMFVLVLGIGTCTPSRSYADLVVEEGTEAKVENKTAVSSSLIAVPEPATFGIVSVGLAICGGLLVRNKRTEV